MQPQTSATCSAVLQIQTHEVSGVLNQYTINIIISHQIQHYLLDSSILFHADNDGQVAFITAGDLRTISKGQWLNDQVIMASHFIVITLQ